MCGYIPTNDNNPISDVLSFAILWIAVIFGLAYGFDSKNYECLEASGVLAICLAVATIANLPKAPLRGIR